MVVKYIFGSLENTHLYELDSLYSNNHRYLQNYPILKIIEPVVLDIDHLIENNSTLTLSNMLEKKYDLTYKTQVIVSVTKGIENLSNYEYEIEKQELLLRKKGVDNPNDILAKIEKGGELFSLFCYMLGKSFETVSKTNIDTSFNVNISDVLHTSFENEVDLIEKQYSSIDNSKIIFEILEGMPLPKDEILRKTFFDKLRYLKNKGFKIAIDDVGGVDSTGNNLYGDIGRILDFETEGVVDIIKLDMLLVRQLYTYHLGHSKDLNIVARTYNIDDINSVIVMEEIKLFHDILKQRNPTLEIIAEGIDSFRVGDNNVDDMQGFIKFLKDIGVDLFQGYFFGKPTFSSRIEND